MLLVRDREHDRLHGGQPQREGSGVMFDENTEKTFDRTHERAMNHDRLMVLPVLSRIGQLEPLRVIEVDLDRRTLPRSAEDVLDLDVDFGAIEHPFAGINLIGDPSSFERRFQGIRWQESNSSSEPTDFSGLVER